MTGMDKIIHRVCEYADIYTLAVLYDVSKKFRKSASAELKVCKADEWLQLLANKKLSTSFTYKFKEKIFEVGLNALYYQIYSESFLLYFAYYAYQIMDNTFINSMWSIIKSRYNTKKFSQYSKNYTLTTFNHIL